MNKIIKILRGSAWPFLWILVVWVIFSSPYFFKGQVPYSSTYQVNFFAPWSAYSQFWGPIKNNAMPDVTTQIVPWRNLTIDTWKMGQVPLWNPYSFAGTPHLANYQSAVFFPLNILFFIFPFFDAWSLLILLQPLIAGVSLYLLMRTYKVSQSGSLVSALSFMFCGFITVWMAYGTLSHAIAILPFGLFVIEKYFQTEKKYYLILLALSIPWSFFSGHFQTSLYFFIFLILYFLYKVIETKYIQKSVWVLLHIIIGFLLTLPQIIPSIEFYLQSFRSALFEKAGAIQWKYIPTLIAPDYYGNPVTRNDWFGTYAEWSSYIGVIGLALAVYALFFARLKIVRFYSIIGFLIFFLAYDSFFLDILVRLHIPVLSTSALSRIIVLWSFSFAVLAGFGFDTVLNDIKNNKRKRVLFWFIVFITVFSVLWLTVFMSILTPHDKISIAKSNMVLPTLLIGLFFSLLIVIHRNKNLAKIAVFCILCLMSFDVLRFSIKWHPFDPRNLVFPTVPVTDYFKKIAGYDRAIGNYGAEVSVFYKIPSLEGYDALYIQRYGKFIASLNDGKVKDLYRSVVMFPKNGDYAPKAIDLLGVRYVIHKKSDGRYGWTFPYWSYPVDKFKKIFSDDAYEVYENTTYIPRAYLVSNYVIQTDEEKIRSIILDTSFDIRNKVVLEKEPFLKPNNKSQKGQAIISEYTPDTIKIKTISEENSLLVITDNFYPGWKAYVDDKETEILRANYSFRSIPIEKGTHIVQLRYQPMSFMLGMSAAVTGVLLLIVVYLFPFFARRVGGKHIPKS